MGLAALLQSLGVRKTVERDWWETVDAAAFPPPARRRSTSARGRSAIVATRCGAAGRSRRTGCASFSRATPRCIPSSIRSEHAWGPSTCVMPPIGAYEPRWFMRTVHMNPEDALSAHRALIDGAAPPPPCLTMHWGTFRLTDEPVEEPAARFAQRWREAGWPGHRELDACARRDPTPMNATSFYRVAGIAGSLRHASFNRALLRRPPSWRPNACTSTFMRLRTFRSTTRMWRTRTRPQR